METDEETRVINLDGPLFAINERSNSGVPAVELDTTTGQRVVLVFTSREAAQKFCYLRRPDAADNIFEFTRRTLEGEIVQTGLIKVARTIRRDHREISAFVIDHPGTKGAAAYLSVEDVAFLGKKKPDEVDEDNFETALDAVLDDE